MPEPETITTPAGRGRTKESMVGPIVAGLLVVLVGYSGPVLIIRTAAHNAGLSAHQLDSWVFTISVGAGAAGLLLSIWLRQPIIVAFSSAGAVLLSSSLAQYRFSEAIGAYLVMSLACVLIGLSRTFSSLIAHIPKAIVSAMLAGVLLRFGIGYFSALPGNPARGRITALITIMGFTYFVARTRRSKLVTVWTCGVGLLAAVTLRLTTHASTNLALAHPTITAPSFRIGAITGLALPLLALALSSQYAPGYAVLRESGYEPNMDRILTVTGGIGAVLAPFGCPGLNLAAITAGIATGPDAHPVHERRYWAGITTGLTYIVVGAFGVSVLNIFNAVPKEFVQAITGLALFGTISNSAAAALSDPRGRDAAAVTLLCAAGEFTLFHVAAPFWALVAGLGVNALQSTRILS